MYRKLGVTLLALLPSLWLLWTAGFAMPQLGYFHDDGLYAGTASALAEGRGYRIDSLPGEPWQVKYPPLFPLYLALGARWEPALLALTWALLPALLYQVWRWRNDPVLVFLLGWNVYSVVFSGTTLSEIFGAVLLLQTVRMLEAERTRAAALWAGLSYLARTAFLALPVGAVLWLLLRRKRREAAEFAAIFVPFFVGWNLWTATHQTPNVTGGSVYYLSYTRFFWENMGGGIWPEVLKANVESLVGSAGGALFFNSGTSFWEMNFARLLLFAAVAGWVRQWREKGWMPYPLLFLPYAALLTVWNFLPNERFLYPFVPLLFEGLLTEIRHLAAMLRKTWFTQRGATILFGTLAAAGAVWIVQRNALASWKYAPSLPLQYLEMKADREKAYAWIRDNTPAGANFLTYEDPSLRRHTGRHGIGIHAPTRFFYRNDMEAACAYHRGLIDNMRAENLQYVLIGPNDLSQDLTRETREKVLSDWRTRPDLETVYRNDRYLIRRLRPVQSGM